MFNYIKKHKILFLIIISAFFFHLSLIFPSGSYYCFSQKCGYFFAGYHAHDSIWHLAVSEVAFNTFPFQAPNYAGGMLYGYNFLMDFFVFILTKFGIPGIISFFKILPIIWFFLFTYAIVILGRKIKNSPLFTAILAFFLFFGGSFGYFLTLYHKQTPFGSEGILAMQSAHMLYNMQFAFSLVVFLTVLILLKNKTVSFKKMLALGFLVFLNLGLKFYGGIISGFTVFSFIFLNYLKRKNLNELIKYFLILGLFVLLAVIIFYDPFYSFKQGKVFIFSPFAIVHSIIEEPNLFYLKNLVNARYFLYNYGWGPRLLTIELFSVFIYVFFNFGTRFFGLLYFAFKLFKRKISLFDLNIFLSILFSIIISVLFIQKGVWWNTVQFFYYAIFLANIFISQFVYELILKGKYGILLALAIFLLTIPINIDFILGLLQFPKSAYISKNEITALRFLKNQPAGIVLAPLYNKNNKSLFNEPYPLYAVSDTSYVAAFSKKQLYIANEQQLDILRINYQDRLKNLKEWNCSLLGKVNYLYELKKIQQIKNFNLCQDKIKKIFENGEIAIYKLR